MQWLAESGVRAPIGTRAEQEEIRRLAAESLAGAAAKKPG
jgi:hypothetical protein